MRKMKNTKILLIIIIIVILYPTFLLSDEYSDLSRIRKTAYPLSNGSIVNEDGVFFPKKITPLVLYWLTSYPSLYGFNQEYKKLEKAQIKLDEVSEKVVTNFVKEVKIQKIYVTNIEAQVMKIQEINKIKRKMENRNRFIIDVISIPVIIGGSMLLGHGLTTGNEPVSYIGLCIGLSGVVGFVSGNIIISIKYGQKKIIKK